MNFSIELILDRTSIDGSIVDTRLNLDSFLTHPDRLSFKRFLYIRCSRFWSHFPRSLLTDSSPHLPNTHFSLKTFNPTWFLAFPYFRSLGMISIPLILHAFHVFRSRFWVFENFLVFFKIIEFLLKFWDGFLFKWSLNLMHCMSIITDYHAFRCAQLIMCW